MRYNNKYDETFIEYLTDTFKLMFQPVILKYYLWLTLPTVILYLINNGVLFIAFFIAICLVSRSAVLGGLLGWFIVSLTVFIFYNIPEPNHFIEYLIQGSVRKYNCSSWLSYHPTSEEVQKMIPVALSSKLSLALIFGAFRGIILGSALGFLAKHLFGSHPKNY